MFHVIFTKVSDKNKNGNISGNILQFKISVYILTYSFYHLFMWWQSWIFSQFSGFFDEKNIQKKIIYLEKIKRFVTIQNDILSLLINLMCPCLIKVLVSSEKKCNEQNF